MIANSDYPQTPGIAAAWASIQSIRAEIQASSMSISPM
jgi:hypothetical protein